MSTHVLLNFLIMFGKVIKCEACRAFITFHNKFNTFNNTRYDIRITLKSHFLSKTMIFLSL